MKENFDMKSNDADEKTIWICEIIELIKFNLIENFVANDAVLFMKWQISLPRACIFAAL